MSEPFVGEIRMFTNSYAPEGWADCTGAIVPISQHTTLYAVIGTTFGGDGRTTMGLPDMTGRAPIHKGRAPGLSYRVMGYSCGGHALRLAPDQIPSHEHDLTAGKITGTTNEPAGQYPAKHREDSGKGRLYYDDATPTDLDAQFSTQAVGQTGNDYHENCQPFLGVRFCIALVGIFPSRN